MSDQTNVQIIKDSISDDEIRLTTFQLKFHSKILPDLLTHRVFSRTALNSLVIPVKEMIKQVREDPMIPSYWSSDKLGMQLSDELTGSDLVKAKAIWKATAIMAADQAETLQGLHLHKQVINDLLEPWLPVSIVLTTTELNNFFNLRIHKNEKPEFKELASKIKNALAESTPQVLKYEHGQWHLPYVSDEELKGLIEKHGQMVGTKLARICSAARCARVSYLNHDKTDPTVEDDLELYNMLVTRPFNDGKGNDLGANYPVHLSLLEHQAKPMEMPYGSLDVMENGYWDLEGVTHVDCDFNRWSGNFRGWVQNRNF